METEKNHEYKLNAKIYNLQDKINFGFYNGSTLEQLIKSNPRYVNWALNNIKWFDIHVDSIPLFAERFGLQVEAGNRAYSNYDSGDDGAENTSCSICNDFWNNIESFHSKF